MSQPALISLVPARRWALRYPLLAAAGGFFACAQTPTVRHGQVAVELTPQSAAAVQTIDGKPVSLEALRAQGPVLLVFLRGFS